MKFYLYKITFVCALIFLLQACAEDEVQGPDYNILQPGAEERSAGNWKTTLDFAVNSITIPAPEATNSAAVQSEIAEVEQLAANLDGKQRELIEKWGSGAVLRWNEIARQLVTKYNVQPLPGAAPDPQRPFANPPYAARLYALLSVAHHDALITVWHNKFKYNRVPVHELVKAPVLIKSNLPSYPSEHATVAAVSAEVLAFFFPLEKDYLNQLAAEHILSMKRAGLHLESDVQAGKAIATAIATKTKDRARTDRMNLASDPTDTYKNIEVPYTKWVSLNVPAIKPMLPLYGNVRSWFDSLALAALLPPPPPAPGTPAFEADLALVKKYATNRSREHWRIADFWADGAGTYTPPGHWNKIAADIIAERNLSEVRAARVFSLLNRAMMDGGIMCWRAKYVYYFPRPSQFDADIKTATGIPNFPGYTSGHATFSAAGAIVLGHLFPDRAAQLQQWAEEAGLSRVVGGIHFQFDNIEGQSCGRKIGQLAVDWAKKDGAE
ncbi:MAG: phosphatase PAP2 family protein [Saprospiraceae bacterium]